MDNGPVVSPIYNTVDEMPVLRTNITERRRQEQYFFSGSWPGAHQSIPSNDTSTVTGPVCWEPMSAAQAWLTVTCSTPGLPVLHHFPEFAQTHVH